MILAINTSTLQFSIALIKGDGTLLAEYSMSSGSKSFVHFMPAVHCLMKASGVMARDLQALIVAKGPGAYTGLRVGLSTAKGMAQGLKIPIIGVSSLEAMASQLAYTSYPICPIIDSRKGEFFAALFSWGDHHEMTRIREDLCLKIEDLPSMIQDKTLFLGNNFNAQGQWIKEALGRRYILAPAYLWNLKASAVGSLGLKRFHESNFDNLQDLVPAYLRPPDIRPNPFPHISEKVEKQGASH
jgi:tRNA threonylcarbamoyladenosine biosynthesis protein TsaB